MKKGLGFRVQGIVSLLLLILTIYCLITAYGIFNRQMRVLAQCQNDRNEGLVTTRSGFNVGTIFGNLNGNCIAGNDAGIGNIKINTEISSYAELKKLFYDKAVTSVYITKKAELDRNATQADLVFDSSSAGTVFYVNGDFTVTSTTNLNQTGIVFVGGSLYINGNITGSTNSGIVFVVNGNTLIDQSVSQIDAVLISQGTIYTATNNNASTTCSARSVTTNPLTVNGSLITLNPSSPIQFCRNLVDNRNPAEVIKQQAKYLAILRDIMSEPLIILSEKQL